MAEIWKNLKFLTWHPLGDLPWNDALDDISKQRYKVKIMYDFYQIRKEDISGDISTFPPVQWQR